MLEICPKGKTKVILSYNKDHGTSSLKKHTFNEHPVVYRRFRAIFASKNGGNFKWEINCKEDDNCLSLNYIFLGNYRPYTKFYPI